MIHTLTGRRSSTPPRRMLPGVIVVSLLMSVLGAVTYLHDKQTPPPDLPQKIVAKLTSWGLSLKGIRIPVNRKEIRQRLADLQSPIGEVRVQAAHWLAARGLRNTGSSIAAAMYTPGTRRPCQLAHSLGYLGDPRWTTTLVQATQNPTNADLRVCATLALEQLQSPQAVQGLIEVYKRDSAPWTAIKALGKIGDASALPMLRNVVRHPRDATERRLAQQAIERIELLQRPDPVPGLIKRIETSAEAGAVEQWAVRQVAERHDKRGAAALRQALRRLGYGGNTIDRVVIAAGLLALGEPGRQALRQIAKDHSPAAATARIALALRSHDIEAPKVARR